MQLFIPSLTHPALKDMSSFRANLLLLLILPSVSLLQSFPCNSVLIRGYAYASSWSYFRGYASAYSWSYFRGYASAFFHG